MGMISPEFCSPFPLHTLVLYNASNIAPLPLPPMVKVGCDAKRHMALTLPKVVFLSGINLSLRKREIIEYLQQIFKVISGTSFLYLS